MGRKKKTDFNYDDAFKTEGIAPEIVETPIEEIPIDNTPVVVEQITYGNETELIQQLQDKFGKPYVDFLKKTGLDIFFKGGWQKHLVSWLNRIFNIRGKNILDIGCAGGAMVSTFNEIAKAQGVDISKYAIENTPFKNIQLHNIPAWKVDSLPQKFDFVYAMETIASIPKEKIQDTFKSVYNVLEKGGIFFATVKHHPELLDSFEVTAMLKADWKGVLECAGFEDITDQIYPTMKSTRTPFDFIMAYDWDVVIGRKKND